MSFDRAIFIVLDSVGVGSASDAKKFGDEGANTLGNITQWCKKNHPNFSLPNLTNFGLTTIEQSAKLEAPQIAYTARLEEISHGKDTTTGHWEFAGQILDKAFPTFPNGFSSEFLDSWCIKNNLTGYLANTPASGTDIIKQFGSEHIKSLKPIVYTSADSVFQIATHEQYFGLEKLYQISSSAREMLDELGVSRVIARPFIGESPESFSRTNNRKDFSLQPMTGNLLDLLSDNNLFVASVGKISDIFAGRSISHQKKSNDNSHGVENILSFMDELRSQRGLIFANLIDFDQLYGHRRDPLGYANCLMQFDSLLPEIIDALDDKTLLIISADHGNDPTFKGSDHTREQVPLFIYSKLWNENNCTYLGCFKGFHSVAKLILQCMGLEESIPSNSKIFDAPNLLEKIGISL